MSGVYCRFCGVDIFWNGERWLHYSLNQPGHIAKPGRTISVRRVREWGSSRV